MHQNNEYLTVYLLQNTDMVFRNEILRYFSVSIFSYTPSKLPSNPIRNLLHKLEFSELCQSELLYFILEETCTVYTEVHTRNFLHSSIYKSQTYNKCDLKLKSSQPRRTLPSAALIGCRLLPALLLIRGCYWLGDQ